MIGAFMLALLLSNQDSGEVAVYQVRHDHGVGSGRGELRITPDGFEFRGDGEEKRHSRTWRDIEIKRIQLSEDSVEIFAFEAGRIPIMPKQVPFVDDTKSIWVGAERRFKFDLEKGRVDWVVVSALEARFKRPLGVALAPVDDADLGGLLFEVPVFHRHLSGGERGMLRAYERRLVFASEQKGHTRVWRYSDLRDLGRLGRYVLEISTYERKAGTGGKSYVYDLGRPLTEAEYDVLWNRLYGRK
jgi:hypothetical protein